uniref:Uncharacterized protein n=1 Tax=Sinocyclocheilus grahami TaxID=75366 RepID=A0A672LIL0_SINGR
LRLKCLLVERDVTNLLEKSFQNKKSNLTHSEKETLDELCRNKDIVIKPADKGGGLVIMPRALYNHEVFRQLENTSYYQALPSDPTTLFQSEIEKFIQEAHFHQLISDKEMRYLLNRSLTRPVFYIVPKVHKTLVNPPGRPIQLYQMFIRMLYWQLWPLPHCILTFHIMKV